ncbi:TlpA family protein disulfide reductase [Terrimonas sp.]|uniref:TlpA family protein disulfide reductase n=1 Tax=Terrimonas sp. TaxID=1914338 RepID=UPI000D525287|nr:TlpA disulfide reductase family protein [Terrimonas sp.]PVD52440.1 TlpA family protein disulfide reductase [Terrimonas sp.]
MKLVLSIFFSLVLLSCSSPNNNKSDKAGHSTGINEDSLNKSFNINPAVILKDFQTWYNYTYFNAPLSQDFIGLDIDSTVIDKTRFLENLMKGNVISLKVKLYQGTAVYKLYKLSTLNKNIASTAAHLAEIEMNYYKMEGMQIPSFDFIDLKGVKYNETSVRGKIMVLKCWFIACHACIEEFPDCNKLVDEYSGRDDILFISLASDKKSNLKNFLQKKRFKYATIPEVQDYITEKLAISMYPTHILVDKSGKIKKVVNSLKELKPFLKKEAEKETI